MRTSYYERVMTYRPERALSTMLCKCSDLCAVARSNVQRWVVRLRIRCSTRPGGALPRVHRVGSGRGTGKRK
eukprot:4142050-Pyramimonas_sp.AAC.1